MPVRHLTAALLFLTIIGTAKAGDVSSKARIAFDPVIQAFDIPGLVVGVTRNGVHDFYVVGEASRADHVPVTPDTLFELGSISKLFNVTLAALAEQRGALRLEDSVAKHVCASTCTIGDDLTLLDLATHHSGGLPLQVPEGISDTAGVVNWLKDWVPPQPGARSYSNISIGLLGYLAADSLGLSYKQAAQTVLFPAFGLQNTWVDVPPEAMQGYAFGYERKTDKPIRVTPGVLDAEAYGVKSNARDMLRFLDVELGQGNAPDELRKAVARTQLGQFNTAEFTQAMVWERYPWPIDVETVVAGNGPDFILKPQPVTPVDPHLAKARDVILNKTGSTNGFGGYVAMVPSEGLGIVVLANRNYPNDARVKATYTLIESLLSQ
ncbi:class C beta-lactamase [Pseudomonas matsuisoli]|uniref:Beta-lactamase n=1 Tax=Pseudomonas matsuisoli TaxID=1515666 RepID=A0A917PR23_9PSED|nr:class C beta-lactamase [Pseudomonas matsuisoli]GGJ88004.1 beta-lactamase [Pseudomonas matsuisoli]